MDLLAGTYTVQITDTNGCVTIQDIVLTAPDPIVPTLLADTLPSGTNISCAGMNDGAVTLTNSGGAGGNTYAWTGPNGFTANTPDISSLFAGQYCATITDANNCNANACITIIEPGILDVTASATAADCGQASGAIDAAVGGGTAPFLYLWSNGSPNEDLSNVATGNYSINVTDANGCIDSTTVQLIGAPAITGDAVVSNSLCNGGDNGLIDLTMISGTAPFSFAWTGGAQSEDINALEAGGYLVAVTDAAGCTWSDVFTVNEPDAIAVDSTVLVYASGANISALGASDGSIAVGASGGTAPFTYLWSNGSTGSSVEGLPAGDYTVTITDANGCTRILEFTLTEPNDIEMPNGFTPNRDGQNDYFVIHGIQGYPDNQFIVLNRWGNVVFDQLNYKNDWAGENQKGDMLPNGTYFVILRLGSDAKNLQGYVDLRR